jgi:radical SAM protein with 4Fe4S-binding SPASM domain
MAVAQHLKQFGAEVNFNVTIDSCRTQDWLFVLEEIRSRNLQFLINPLRGEAARRKFNTAASLEEYLNCIEDLYKSAMSEGFRELRVMNVRAAIHSGAPVDKDCFLNGGRQIIVLPDGSFTTCFDDLATQQLQFPETYVDDLNALSAEYYPIGDPECATCSVQRYCSAGCARQTKDPDQPGWMRDRVICRITKTITAREFTCDT